VKRRLHEAYEGMHVGRFGFVVLIDRIEELGKGKIIDGAGMIQFSVRFLAVVMRPFKNEVLEATVESVHEVCPSIHLCYLND
jgi:DNA-directed RNA polymerase subunit E'/Rpb7